MKRFFITLITVALFISSATALSTQEVVDNFAQRETFRYGALGICVYDINTKQVVAASNELQANITASTMKTVTWYAALSMLGKDFQYTTKVNLIGNIDNNGTLNGGLEIVGGGDPTLGSIHHDNQPDFIKSIISALKAKGIKRINGNIIVTPTENVASAYDNDWCVDDVTYDYGAGAFLFNYADNETTISAKIQNGNVFTTGKNLAEINTISRTYVDENGNNTPDIFRGTDSKTIIFDGPIKAGARTANLSVSIPSPARYFINLLTQELKKAKITVTKSKNTSNGKEQLLAYQSPTLAQIATYALHQSHNMYTECALRTIAYQKSGVWNCDEGIQLVRKFFQEQGLNTDMIFQKDGSGLARRNRVAPIFFCQMLANATASINFEKYLPHIGIDGTVRKMWAESPFKGKAVLKSGSMGEVLCYAGYYPAENPQYSISIICNNFLCTSTELRQQMAIFVNDLLSSLDIR